MPPDAQTEYERQCQTRGSEAVRRHSTSSLRALAQERYVALLPGCTAGGRFHGAALWCFAGKDLVWALESALKSMGHDTPPVFLERIMTGIEDSMDDVWTWVPEWSALRATVLAT